ncbi:hypothetical protein ACE6H2_008886 [Prunus campanulata]
MLVKKQKTYSLLDADDDDGDRSSAQVVSESRKADSHKKLLRKKVLSQEEEDDEVIAQEEEERRDKRRIPQMTMMETENACFSWVLITGNWHVKPDDNDLFQDVISKLKL